MEDENARKDLFAAALMPRYYHRDGSPFVSDDLLPDDLQWALLFEKTDRHVALTRTIYRERLSTIWLGLDHGFFGGRPLIFETMLFAPGEEEDRKRFPHASVLQLRYSNEDDARDRHERLKLQCLIPPRWRHFILWTIGRDPAWAFYDDNYEDIWT